MGGIAVSPADGIGPSLQGCFGLAAWFGYKGPEPVRFLLGERKRWGSEFLAAMPGAGDSAVRVPFRPRKHVINFVRADARDGSPERGVLFFAANGFQRRCDIAPHPFAIHCSEREDLAVRDVSLGERLARRGPVALHRLQFLVERADSAKVEHYESWKILSVPGRRDIPPSHSHTRSRENPAHF